VPNVLYRIRRTNNLSRTFLPFGRPQGKISKKPAMRLVQLQESIRDIASGFGCYQPMYRTGGMNCLRAECVESSSDLILGHEVRMFESASEPPEVTAIYNQFRCIFKAHRGNFRRIQERFGNCSIGDMLPSGSRPTGRV
jgi:hypothetical protein